MLYWIIPISHFGLPGPLTWRFQHLPLCLASCNIKALMSSMSISRENNSYLISSECYLISNLNRGFCPHITLITKCPPGRDEFANYLHWKWKQPISLYLTGYFMTFPVTQNWQLTRFHHHLRNNVILIWTVFHNHSYFLTAVGNSWQTNLPDFEKKSLDLEFFLKSCKLVASFESPAKD